MDDYLKYCNHFTKNIDGVDKDFYYINIEDLRAYMLPRPVSKNNKTNYHKSSFINLGCGFDIETSKIPGTVKTTMYVWQFSIEKMTVIGRYWGDFVGLLSLLEDAYHLDEKNRILCFIHNMKYEWSFMKKQIPWNYRAIRNEDKEITGFKADVFAIDERAIVKAVSSHYIEFRDSYILTRYSLGKLAEVFKLENQKLKGELDYSKVRHRETPLTNDELAYCINDVQILSEFYHKYITKEFLRNNYKIPLTSTGIIRDEMKRAFKQLPKKERDAYKRLLKNCFPETEEHYKECIKWLYRGGFVHANATLANETHISEVMGSFDFKSSYPAIMLQESVPWIFEKRDPDWFYQYGTDKKILSKYAYYGEFKIYGIQASTPHTIESKSKLIDYSDDAVFDNGRLYKASWVVVMLTEQDVLNYTEMYSIDRWVCHGIRISVKKPLPKFLKDLVLKYYYLKEKLTEEGKKDTIEYQNAKSLLNAFYGMCVTAIVFNDTRFDDETGEMYIAGQGDYYSSCKKLLLLPQWGIWISAIARRRLIHTFYKIDTNRVKYKHNNITGYAISKRSKINALYGDTDSIKLINLYSNMYVFNDYNTNVIRKNKSMYVGEYDRKYFAKLGTFDFEGKSYRFKTLGCKRYMYTQIEYNKKLEKYELSDTIKIAGMVKGSLKHYCKDYGLDLYETFDDNLILDEDYSDKLTTYYPSPEDSEFEMDVTDYLGNVSRVSERSFCTLIPTTFSMKVDPIYLETIKKIVEYYNKTGVVNEVV